MEYNKILHLDIFKLLLNTLLGNTFIRTDIYTIKIGLTLIQQTQLYVYTHTGKNKLYSLLRGSHIAGEATLKKCY